MSKQAKLRAKFWLPTQHPLSWLWSLTFLFGLRVLGQVLVVLFQPPFLPPMAHWYSGLLPYPLLLPTQILILGLQVKINRDWGRRTGFFRQARPSLGKGLQGFSLVYAIAMAIRYGLTMTLYPDRRWLGEGTIPILFHWVLAAYCWLWGWGHHAQRQP